MEPVFDFLESLNSQFQLMEFLVARDAYYMETEPSEWRRRPAGKVGFPSRQGWTRRDRAEFDFMQRMHRSPFPLKDPPCDFVGPRRAATGLRVLKSLQESEIIDKAKAAIAFCESRPMLHPLASMLTEAFEIHGRWLQWMAGRTTDGQVRDDYTELQAEMRGAVYATENIYTTSRSDDSDLITRKALLEMEDIETSTLNYRINHMGHPKPVRTEGRNQWFSISQVDAWLKSLK
jgi:hypothetical protein